MKPAAAIALAVGCGFLFGFLWGGSTRDQLGGATKTTFNDGVLRVEVDTMQALEDGLRGLLMNR